MGKFTDATQAENTIKNSLKEGLAGTGDGTTMADVLKATWSQFGEKGFSDIMTNTLRYQESARGALKGNFSLADGARDDGKISLDEVRYQGRYDAMTTYFKLPAKCEPNGSETILEGTARRQYEDNSLFRQIYDAVWGK